MQDEFDNGMGMPDDELTGDATLSDEPDLTGGLEGDLLGDLEEPGGRPSGGARARKVAFVPRPRVAAKAVKAGKPSKKSAPAKKKSAKKAAKKGAKKTSKKKGKAKAARASHGKKKRAGKKK